MRLLTGQRWRGGLWIIVLAFTGYQYIHTPASHAPTNLSSPPGGLVENDTGGKVPGNPRVTIEAMQGLYTCMRIYQDRRGIRPAKMGDLLVDMVQHPHEYGFQDFRQANLFFHTPDAQYADNPMARSNPGNYIPYILTAARPDGREIGGPKLPGTRDVVATTTIYYHQNVRHFQDNSADTDPVGYHLVLWEDGAVQKVPFQQFLYIPHGRDFGIAYPGQAGVPSNAMTSDQFNRQIMHRASEVARNPKP